MAKQTVIGVFDNPANAECAVNQLIQQGVDRDDISVVANDARGDYKKYKPEDTAGKGGAQGTTRAQSSQSGGGSATAAAGGVDTDIDDRAASAGVGAAVGAGIGALLGLAWLMVPGVGPVLTAGHIAAALGIGALAGAATGSLVAALAEMGVPEEDANVYAEAIRRGGTLVSVAADEARVPAIIMILDANGAMNPKDRATQWRQSGWKGFDQGAKPMTAEQVATENAARPAEQSSGARAGTGATGGASAGRSGSAAGTGTTTGAARSGGGEAARGRPQQRPGGTSGAEDHEPEVVVVEEEVVFAVPPIPVSGGGGARMYSRGPGAGAQTAQGGRGGGTEVAPDAFGAELARDQRFRGRDWASAEPEARRSFEQRYPGSKWEQFKEAVSRGFEKIRQKV